MLVFQFIVLCLYITIGLGVGRKVLRKLNNKLYCRCYGRRPEPREFN